MKIRRIQCKNYRSLEDIDVNFSETYTAICGRNDAGKTNLVRALQCLMTEYDPYSVRSSPEINYTEDFTKWNDRLGKEPVSLCVEVSVNRGTDTGLHEFLTDYLDAENTSDLVLSITTEYTQDTNIVRVSTNGKDFEGIKAESVLQKIKSSRTFLFHNSTSSPRRFQRMRGFVRDVAEEHEQKLNNAKQSVNRVLKRIAKDHQEELGSLLGRLKEKYKVSLSLPPFDFEYLPFILTLGDSKVDVSIEEWGSGTRNRTMILLAIFQAKRISDSAATASKVTPVIVVEEPESFLHPSAQSDFGQVLQDVASEFGIQLIVTTHSPYLLSQHTPQSNILLNRKEYRQTLRQTELMDTSGEAWKEPFALALGLSADSIEPWKDVIFQNSQDILLVEGDLDKEYFKLLQDPSHGSDALLETLEIFPYGGKDALKNQSLLKFIRNRFKRVFITFDLDAEGEVKRSIESLGFEKAKSYLPVGQNVAGKRDIEGLIPDAIRSVVYNENPVLVAALGGTSQERNKAKSDLKKKLLAQFKSDADKNVDYANFYKVAKVINKHFG